MRTRTRSTKRGPSYTLMIRTKNAGLPSESANNFHTAYVGKVETMEDNNNSATYRTNVVLSPCNLTRVSREAEENPKVHLEAPNINGSIAEMDISGDFAGYCAYSLPNVEVNLGQGLDISLMEAYAKMNESATLAGEQIATMKQTVEMIRSPLKSLQKAIKNGLKVHYGKVGRARSKYLRGIGRISKRRYEPIPGWKGMAKQRALEIYNDAVSKSYLELRYGIFPFMWDVETHLEKIIEELNDPWGGPVVRTARGGSCNDSISLSGTSATEMPYLSQIRSPSFSWSVSKQARGSAGVVYLVKPRSTIDEALGHLGLRLRDIPQTLWELIPLSFVADWAFNIGRFLQAIIPVPGIQPYGNWKTVITEEVRSVNSVNFHVVMGWFTNHRRDATFPGASEQKFSYVRTVDNSLASHPMFLGKPLSNMRIGDAVSLLAIRVGRLIPR